MTIEQIYTGCLAQGAYYIQSGNEAVVIEPLREVASYIQKAERNKATIKYVLETHFHADFVSGHLDLAKKTGATIVYGPEARPAFEAHIAKDGEELKVGNITIQVIHTPGHTMESSCYLLKDEKGKPVALFSGDTLFIGDVGRPDLAQKVKAELTQDVLAAHLFDSLRNKIMTLPDDVVIYPAHGAGSACGKNMSKETTDTLGHQKRTNYALRPDMTKEEFIKEVTTGLTTPPSYFPLNVMMNIKGYESIDKVLERGQHAFDPDAFEAAANETGALILDTRDALVFAKGFIPGAVNIGLEGRFAEWVATLFPFDVPVVLVTDSGKESEAIVRMARVGFDRVAGYLAGGFAKWQEAGEPVDLVIEVEPDEVLMDIPYDNNMLIVDVRKEAEFANEHVRGALNLPLNDMADPAVLAQLDERDNLYVHCQSGYRSMVACSVMKKEGFHNLRNITGGFNHLKETPGIALEKDEQVMN